LSPAKRHMDKVAQLGCVVCRRIGFAPGPVELHHVAEGSGVRSDYAVVPLCPEHHDGARAGTGFHGMGTKRFCSLFRVPGESEYGLLIWVNEDLAKQ
jgi:hypothetical protein